MLKGTGSISGLHRVLAVFRGPHPADTADTPFTSRFCRDCLYSGSCTTHAPSTRSIWAFSSAHTPSTRSILAACTPILSVLGVCSILGASVQPRSFSPSFFLCVSYTDAASGLLSRSMELLAIRKSSVCTQNRGPLAFVRFVRIFILLLVFFLVSAARAERSAL